MERDEILPGQQEIQAEPQGGPKEREREFLEERMTRMAPKEEEAPEDATEGEEAFGMAELELDHLEAAPEGEPSTAAAAALPPEAEEDQEAAPSPAELARHRRDQLTRYHQRVKGSDASTGEGEAGAASAGEASEEGQPAPGADGAPEPPAPPPAVNWIPIGPSVMRQGQGAVNPAVSGRTVAIAVATGGNRVYIGAANGGVWRSGDAGENWTSTMDAFDLNPQSTGADSLAVGAIALVQGTSTATDRLYVGSGEGPGSAYFGVGPLVSPNGGTSWNTEPTRAIDPDLVGRAFYAMAVDPADSDLVVGATTAGVYTRVDDGSGGFEWARQTLPGALTAVGFAGPIGTSVVAARTGSTTTFYAATWFGPVQTSTDGTTWTNAGTGFPTTNVGRIGLAVRPDDPSVVYALVHDNSTGGILGVWRLDTSDNTWRQVTGHPADLFGTSAIGFQGSYDLAIAVDPNNVGRLYLGGSTKQASGSWSASLYRCSITSSGSGAGLTYSMTNTYIGASVHADVHNLTFAPADSNKLWVGCDGGVFYSTNPTGTGNIFNHRNKGLQTLTMNHLALHPTEDAVVFAGTQDNGGGRYTGEEAWLHSVWGDAGHFVINWNDPYKVLSTYVRASVNRSTDGGTRYNYTSVSVPAGGDNVLFYAPLVGTPVNTASRTQAERVAFGSNRPWISDTFGGAWSSIPNGNTTDRLGTGNGFRIRSMIFASYTRLFVGTMNGRVYRYDEGSTGWARTRIDNTGTTTLPFTAAITDIAVDPADTTGASIYVTYGGFGDYRHVWHFDGTTWEQRSGPAATAADQLLDVQHTAIATDPANPTHVYVGADIGVWRSTDSGTTWDVYSQGLPDAGVMDLKFHAGRRLLRVSTHGRGVWEREIDAATVAGVDLYLRDTQLDMGRFTTVNGLPDPTDQGETVRHWRGPGIKLDTPDALGNYQFPITGPGIDFLEFVDELNDDSRTVATHATATITTKVYVQVHNRGVTPADNVQVMCLLANASAGLPALPAGFQANVQSGTPINTANWKTLGVKTVDDVRVGFPRVVDFDLTSDKLPPPSSLAGNDHHCVLALVHHTGDNFTSTTTNTDNLSRTEPKSCHKNLKVVEFTGTLPAPPPIIAVVRLNNADVERERLCDLVLRVHGYRGRLRVALPRLETAAPLEQLLKGFRPDDDLEDFSAWAEQHLETLERDLESERGFNPEWTKQRIEAVHSALNTGLQLTVTGREHAELRAIRIPPGGYHSVFVIMDRPVEAQLGDSFPVEVIQRDTRSGRIIGGIDVRADVVKAVREERKVAVALHRYWNARIGDHFYTTDFAELGRGRLGYRYEGIQCYVHAGKEEGAHPLYRYWNPRIGDHFYTTEWREVGAGRYGWKYEGIQCYVPAQRGRGTQALLRYWNPVIGDHFYTTSWRELGWGRNGWRLEGIQCYVHAQAEIQPAEAPVVAQAPEAAAVPASFRLDEGPGALEPVPGTLDGPAEPVWAEEPAEPPAGVAGGDGSNGDGVMGLLEGRGARFTGWARPPSFIDDAPGSVPEAGPPDSVGSLGSPFASPDRTVHVEGEGAGGGVTINIHMEREHDQPGTSNT